jgi:subtilisin
VPAAAPADPGRQPYIVVLAPGADPGELAGRIGAIAERTYSAAINGFAAELGPGQVKHLEDDPRVEAVVPDADGYELAAQEVPTGVRRVGGLASPTARIDGSDERVDADIAIIDSGIDSSQPDLNVAGGYDCGGSGTLEDWIGHGTMVAGVAAAIDDDAGVVGVAPGARLWSVPIEDRRGRVHDSAVICALDWVTAHADVIDVANMSVDRGGKDSGRCGLNPAGRVRDPLHAAICAAVSAGVTVVAAAGNKHVDAARSVPAAFDEVITVSALADTDGMPGGEGGTCDGEEDDALASFSNFGAVVDIAAPGVCIETTRAGGGTAVVDGTSFSTPHVAGAAALWIAGHPGATPADVRAAILANREQGPLEDDPDGIDEGVLRVDGF